MGGGGCELLSACYGADLVFDFQTWKKFGEASSDPPGPNPSNTICSPEDIFMQFVHTKDSNQENENEPDPLASLRGSLSPVYWRTDPLSFAFLNCWLPFYRTEDGAVSCLQRRPLDNQVSIQGHPGATPGVTHSDWRGHASQRGRRWRRRPQSHWRQVRHTESQRRSEEGG